MEQMEPMEPTHKSQDHPARRGRIRRYLDHLARRGPTPKSPVPRGLTRRYLGRQARQDRKDRREMRE